MLLPQAPEASSHGESLSTLQFGQKVSSVSLGQATRGSERVAAPREPSQSAREALEARARSEGYDAAVAKMRGDLDQERLKARRAMDECDALRK